MIVVRVLLTFAYCVILTRAFLKDPTLPLRSTKARRHPSASHEAAGEPLFLTPLIDAGNLTEARDRSRVTPLLDNIESYSAFLTVNKTSRSHLFFWFFRTTGVNVSSSSAPTILWLQGGPGCSSMFGLFAENGPFEVVPGAVGLRRRTHAWTDHYNVLYIDSPVGTGFSFTEGGAYVTNEDQIGDHLYEALVQFYKVFGDDLKKNGLYVAGESYAGKYIPAVAHKIHVVNKRRGTDVAHRIPLKGLLYGNGYSDPENQQGVSRYLEAIGFIDEQTRIELEQIENQMVYAIRSGNWSLANQYDSRLGKDLARVLDSISLYDFTRDNYGGYDDSFVEFLTRDRIRRKLHVGRAKYEIMSTVVNRRLENDNLQSTRPWIEELLEHYPMLFYNGQFDIVCAHPLTDNFLKKLHWSGASQYGMARKRAWRVDNMVGGFYNAAGNLVFMMVRNAGHNVPADQPRNTLAMIDMFIQKKFT